MQKWVYNKLKILTFSIIKSIILGNFFKKFDIGGCYQAFHICKGVLSQILQKQAKESLLCSKSQHALHTAKFEFRQYLLFFCISLNGKLRDDNEEYTQV